MKRAGCAASMRPTGSYRRGSTTGMVSTNALSERELAVGRLVDGIVRRQHLHLRDTP